MTDQLKMITKETGTEALETKEFPYTGIFSTGGLLSHLQYSEESEVEQIQDQDQQASIAICSSLKHENLQHSKENNEETTMTFTIDLSNKMRDLPPPNEGVVTIDHILEQLFTSLKPRELLTCRLVSHRWRIFAQIPLQNQLQLKFVDQKLIPPISSKSKLKSKTKIKVTSNSPSNSAQVGSPITSPKTLTAFNKFLEQSLHISQQLSLPFTFPCSKFSFHETLLSDPELQKFLNLHGLHIDELTLHFCPARNFYRSQSPEGTSDRPSHPHERDLMIQIKTLLLQQTPNVSVLKVGLYSKIDWEDNFYINGYGGQASTSWLRTSDPEFQQIHSTVINSQLKTLQILGILSAKVFEVICTLCPSLEEITFDSNSFEYVLKPMNRIHCLKTLFFNLNDRYYYNFKRYEDLADAIDLGKENLQLRTFSMHMYDDLKKCDFASDPQVERRVVNVLNKILQSSWKSLEKIKWDGVTFLKGVKWPLVMPNVTKLELLNPIEPSPRGSHTVFPEGSGNLKQMFPKLKCVTFISLKKAEGENFVNIEDFFAWLNIVEPVPGIQSVLVNGTSVMKKKHCFELLCKLFPGARVRLHMF